MTTISSLSSSTSNTLLTDLEANGLTATKAQTVVNDFASAVLTASSGSTSGQVSMTTIRAALDKQIDADVASGKLTASDAAEVKKTLDQIDAQSSGSSTLTQATTAAQSAGTSSGSTTSTSQSSSTDTAKAGHGGGGGGSSSTKTEISETVTISGALMTTTITYSDGSTSTTTTAATPQDIQEYGTQSDNSSAAASYLATLKPGTLFNQSA
jgi:hypothetical protein